MSLMAEDDVDPVVGSLIGVHWKRATAAVFEHTIGARSVR